jgi:hypothetical protein
VDKGFYTFNRKGRCIYPKGGENIGTIATARKVYAAKVCKGYLGIDETGCNAAFDRLIENMRSGYNALGGTSAVSEVAESPEMPSPETPE